MDVQLNLSANAHYHTSNIKREDACCKYSNSTQSNSGYSECKRICMYNTRHLLSPQFKEFASPMSIELCSLWHKNLIFKYAFM